VLIPEAEVALGRAAAFIRAELVRAELSRPGLSGAESVSTELDTTEHPFEESMEATG
jgi:hypothetical protein